MKKFLIPLFVLILFTAGASFAKETTNKQEEYKTLKCNETSGACIVRDKVLKYGIKDKNGKIVLPVEYSHISLSKDGSNNFVLVKDNKTGIANASGKLIIPCKYLSVIRLKKGTNKYIVQSVWGEHYGLADMKTGNIDIQPIYQHISLMRNGAYLVEWYGKKGVINQEFHSIIPSQYYFIMLFPGDMYYRLHKEVTVTNKEGLKETIDRFGIADLKGRFVVPVECSHVDKNKSSYKQKVVKDGQTYIFDVSTGNLSSP